jgi:3-oxoadipate enol-lactonase
VPSNRARVTPRSGAAGRQARPPVLFLTGVGLTSAVAARSIVDAAAHFHVLATPGGEATVEGALAVLDSAAVDQAHIVGVSFGGMVAQEIAIGYPDRVRSLVLGATSAGGGLCVPADAPIREFTRHLADLPAEEGLWAAVPYLYAPVTRHRHAPRIGEDIARRLNSPLDPRSLRRQDASARTHDAGDHLARISAPTLVIHGEQDRIVPLANGRRLAAGIAGAQLITLPGGAHAFPTDVPDANRELVSFLLADSRPQRRPGARRGARAERA